MLYINAYVKKMILTRKLKILKQLSDQNITQLIGLLLKNYFPQNKKERTIYYHDP